MSGMPPLAAPQPQPTFLGTPFATSSTQNPFEYPFAPAGPPSPALQSASSTSPGSARSDSSSPVYPLRVGSASRATPPIPPTLLARRATPKTTTASR
ncbi:hypothetical protein EXIGLDRAFT_723461 [Exidia glandulosa HHB12029]|uniref:Uncharacterized protein n=1 Tax=Exidia glandulosa HHB12029 TaxID=1314781 RepID=A0A165E6N8_EXIGL|nr:hypothetical protein EXIGLDRAFT_725112 [Exidia glandulosa HHB12029]KZV86797.1 hypothetical protein EXIGLDRAFT_724426 [Exidia glandulosa HHB12029]KZV87703.1 hypothetical protein EXIGLDRAFT_723461 [Exidia glandulosa HHB12029]